MLKLDKRKIIYIATIVISVLFIFLGNKVATKDLQLFAEDESAAIPVKVVHISNKSEDKYTLGNEETAISSTTITFIGRVVSGKDKGKTVEALQTIDDLYAIQPSEVKMGDKVLVFQSDPDDPNSQYIMSEQVRTDYLLYLLFAFFACLLLFGGKKGANTIISLSFTVSSVLLVFLPAVLSGQNIYFWSIAICTFIILMTLIIVFGITQMSIATAISCFAGMLVCGGLTAIMTKVMALTGMVDDESYFLTQLPTANPINLNAITFAAITIGAIGAVIDVSISVSAALQELNIKAPHLSRLTLMRSGMTIGRDMMGTMANTLVLAYIGSSLSVTLLLIAYQTSIAELLNKELIITEMLQILVGSFGILMTIPMTSFFCALFFKKTHKPSIAVEA